MFDGDGDRPVFYTQSHPVARRVHRCSECRRGIDVGERYWRVSGKWDGQIDTVKTCSHCEAAAGWLEDRCDGYILGMIIEDLVAHWDEEGVRERVLGRLIVSARRQWRRLDGSLMPVPRVGTADRAG